MQIKVNKDFLHEYKNEFWRGFDLPELVSVVIGLGCDGAVVYLAWKYFHIAPDNAVYLGLPAMIPPIVIGFYKFQGQVNPLDYAKAMYDTYKCKELPFHGETRKVHRRIFYMNRGEKEVKKR